MFSRGSSRCIAADKLCASYVALAQFDPQMATVLPITSVEEYCILNRGTIFPRTSKYYDERHDARCRKHVIEAPTECISRRCIVTVVSSIARCRHRFFFPGLRRRRAIFVRSHIGGADDKWSLFSNDRGSRYMHLQIALLSCPRDHREGIGLSPPRYRTQNRYGAEER